MSTTKRIDTKTPNGGSYCVITFLNEKDEAVEEEKATRCRISEYDEKDELISETVGILEV